MVSLLIIVLVSVFALIHLSVCNLDPSSLRVERDVPSFPSTTSRSVLDLFNTKANTIIRTKESRDFGARYLNESEQISQEECIAWCWNYKSADNSNPCNVAVYEQKERHSCYLFDCGSQNSFKCKFSDHDSYTSSVLNVTRQTYELAQWRDQSQHESDLKNLLRSEASIPADSPTQKVPSNSWNNILSPTTKHRCQHFQFPCKNGTECIAIYNVCDGIAQCPDGSDEGDDLKCPQNVLNDVPRPKMEPTYKPMMDKSRKGPVEDVLTNPRMFEYPKAPEADLIPGRTYGNKFQPGGVNEGFRYNPIPQSEYFNPSGSYLFPDQDYSRDLTTLFWPSVQAAQPPPPSRIQPNELRESFLRPDNINLEPLSQPLNLRLSELAKERGHKDWSLLPRDPSFDARSNSVQLPRFGLNPVSEPSAAVPTAPTGDPITSAKTISPPREEPKSSHPQFHSSALVASPEAIAVIHLRDSGSSGRDTNSAVIALTLGICITVMLVVLVGCRMKSIHRKIARRGGRSLAHDADYLVNGMYL